MPKLTPTIPSLWAIASNCASVKLRGCGQRAWALEWVATSGAVLNAAVCQKVFSFMCETSIMMRRWLQARISASPAGVRPGPVSGEPGNGPLTPVPKAFGRFQNGPMLRTPSR
ncbi:Uncharacterised protein [Acinetobacter baumannii]|nr:Uncharacterised protein [Acinetobacter baumannii]